jgi:hypothetical protein
MMLQIVCWDHIPVASDGVDGAVVATERNIESNDGVASLDQAQVFLGDVSLGGGTVEEELDLLEEAGLLELVELGTEALRVDLLGLGEGGQLYTYI